MPHPGLLHPEPLPLRQATADLYLCRRHSQFCLSLCGVSGSWCAQAFVCALYESVSPALCKFWLLYGGVNGNLLQKGLCHNQVYCKKAKWLSEEALQIAMKRREAKGKREKETYTHLNVEFQRRAKRDKDFPVISANK